MPVPAGSARRDVIPTGTVAENIAAVRARIEAAARRAGRSPDGVRIVAVSKGFPPERILEAVAAGITDIGENRLQEALPKVGWLKERGINVTWHFVGHLQTNKVKGVLAHFDIIHSVDSVRLAREISRRATRPVPVLLQVNVAAEATKGGFILEPVLPDRDLFWPAWEEIRALPNLDVRGLMTIAPQAENPEEVRPVFRRLRELAETLGLPELSMGMTEDYEVAVEEGTTMVRLGRAIFGERRSE
jgi:pyridoxal phosphate enzyme (YggS family)